MQETGIVELIDILDDSGIVLSGGPSHVHCPSCKQGYIGYPRVPKTLVYRCNSCGHMFDIYGKRADSTMLHAGGVFFKYEEPPRPEIKQYKIRYPKKASDPYAQFYKQGPRFA